MEKSKRKCAKSGDRKTAIDVDALETPPPLPKPATWIDSGMIKLTNDDHGILESPTEWLNSDIINAAQTILSEQFGLPGLQNSELGSVFAFSIEANEFVQILHGAGHWLTISTIGTEHSNVFVYDSLYSSPPAVVKQQIAALLATPKSEIQLQYVDVQMQSGANDCGLFAIAFATALCLGELPGKYIFEQRAMRGHLMKCLEAGEFSMFPVRKIRRSSKRIKSTSIIKVYCDCRMPELPSSMVQCTKCHEWFHFLCVDVCGLNHKSSWFCTLCLKALLYSVPRLLLNTCNSVLHVFHWLEKHFKINSKDTLGWSGGPLLAAKTGPGGGLVYPGETTFGSQNWSGQTTWTNFGGDQFWCDRTPQYPKRVITTRQTQPLYI